MASEFEWGKDADAVVFPTTSAVAVYVNGSGDLVIRQEASEIGDHDDTVVVPRMFVSRLVEMIQALMKD